MNEPEFKEGDRIQFLGIFDDDPDWKKWASNDGLVPLGVYIAQPIGTVLYLEGSSGYCYLDRYFQKIEPEKEEET